MELIFDKSGDVDVCCFSGRLDSVVADDFRSALQDITEKCTGSVVLDMEQVAFIGSACLGAMVSFRQKLTAGSSLALCGLSVPIHKMFVVATFDKIFKIAGTADEGVALLKGA